MLAQVRRGHSDGVFAAHKIDAAGLVLPANVEGQIGNEDFDWSALKMDKTADVRSIDLLPPSPNITQRLSPRRLTMMM